MAWGSRAVDDSNISAVLKDRVASSDERNLVKTCSKSENTCKKLEPAFMISIFFFKKSLGFKIITIESSMVNICGSDGINSSGGVVGRFNTVVGASD